MRLRLTPIAIVLALGTFGAAQTPSSSSGPLVVHEWGTFTSVAGQDGRAVEWLPLPSFRKSGCAPGVTFTPAHEMLLAKSGRRTLESSALAGVTTARGNHSVTTPCRNRTFTFTVVSWDA